MRSIFGRIKERLSYKKRQDSFSVLSSDDVDLVAPAASQSARSDALTEEYSEEIESRLNSLEKESKTTIPVFIKLHNNLRSKYAWYYNWHENPISHLVHWITLAGFTAVMAGLVFVSVFGNHAGKIKAASRQSWDNQAAWGEWNLNNVAADATGLTLKSAENTQSDSSSVPSQYVTEGVATYQFTPLKDETVDWLSADLSSQSVGQSVKQEYSTDNVLFTDKIDLLANSSSLFVRLTLDSNDPSVTPVVSSLTINYSRLPDTPTGLSFSITKKIFSTSQILQAGTFSDPDGDQHQASQWQVTTKSGDYSNLKLDSGNISDQKDLPTYVLPQNLAIGQYYFRVRYQDSTGAWSLWSGECAFAVGDNNSAKVEGSQQIVGDPKEVISKRTENSETIKNDNGTYTLNSYAGPIHYKDNYTDSNAQWKSINPNHSIDTPEYVLFDALPSTVKVFKDKIGYEIQSRQTGEKYDVVLQDVDGNPKLSFGKGSTGKVAWADINTPSSKLKVESQKLASWILPQTLAGDNQVTKDDGNVKFEFQISENGVRLWKTITGDAAPKNFKWKITKSGTGNTLKFRDKPDAYDLNPDGSVELNAKVPIEAKKISTDASGFVWQETAPSSDMKIDTDVIVNFYSDQYNYGPTTVDGTISALSYAYNPYSWADITSLTSGGNASTSESSSSNVAGWDMYSDECGGGGNGFGNNYRSAYLFDTSSIPDTGTVSAATFSIRGYASIDKVDTHSWNPSLNVYSSSPTSNTDLSSSDYPHFGSTAFSDSPITLSSYSISGYNNFSLNSYGLAAITKNGVSKFGLRTTADATGTAPALYADGSAYFGGYFTELGSGSGYQPKLTVTYSGGATISGHIYTDTSKSGTVSNSTNVSMEINGSTSKRTVQTTTGGVFSFPGVELSAGQVVSIFTDGSYNYTSLVMVAAGTSDVTGLEMYTNYAVAQGTITNAAFQTASANYESGLGFSSSSDANFTNGLFVPSGSTYTPGGAVQVGYNSSGDLFVAGTMTMYTGGTSYNLTVNGTGYLSGTFNGGAGVHQFSGFSQTAGTFTGSTSAFNMSYGNFSLSGGTFTAGTAVNNSGTNYFGSFSQSGGTFNAGTATDSFASIAQTTGTGIFNGSSATITDSGDFNVAGGTFNASSGTTTFSYPNNFIISNTFVPGTSTFVFNSYPSTLTIGSNSLYNLTIDGSSNSIYMYSGIAVSNNFVIASGYVNPYTDLSFKNFSMTGGSYSASGNLTVSGNWTMGGSASFSDNCYSSTTVTFTGSPTITGNTTFCNFTADTGGKTLTFAANSTQTIEGVWDVMGSASGTTNLVSSTPGPGANTQWKVDPQGTVLVANASSTVNVTDSNNLATSPISVLNTGSNDNIVRVARDTNWVDGSGTCTWVGGSGGNDWSNTLNWSDGTLPSSICDVVFDGTSTKASNIEGAYTIKSLSINSGYTNTLTAGHDLTVNNNVNLAAGTFSPASYTINVGGNWNNTGGTFTKGTSTVNFTGNTSDKTISTNGTGTGKDFYNVTIAGTNAPDAYAKLLLHVDSNFSDSSTSAHVLTATGATINTSTKHFGAGSMYFDGNSHVLTPVTSDFEFGTGDFTIDFWINPSSSNENATILSLGDAAWSGAQYTGWTIRNVGTDGLMMYRYDGMTETPISLNMNPPANTWSHVAITRQGTTLYSFLGGVQEYSGSNSVEYNKINSDSFRIGDWAPAPEEGGVRDPFSGYLDEIRISKGIARWTSAFTPPASAYDNLSASNVSNFTTQADTTATNNLTVSTGTLTAGSYNLHAGNVIETGGVLVAPGSTKSFTVDGGWNHSGGTFTHNSGVVTFAGDDLIQGDNTFYGLTHATTGKTITVAASTTQTISGPLSINGTDVSNKITLVSSSPGTRWNIAPNGTKSVSWVTVSDSTSSVAIDATNSTEGTASSTTNWLPASSVVAPTVSTTSPVPTIAATTAAATGSITDLGGDTITACGVKYGLTETDTWTQAAVSCTGTAPVEISSSLTSLSPYTTYHVRAFATNSAGTGYGSYVSFVTLASTPTVTTQAASSVSTTTATGNGNITVTGGATASVRGFEYKADASAGHDCSGDLSSPSTSYDSVGGYGTGAYTKGISGLTANTYYCARAYATSSASPAPSPASGYGSWVSFDTLADTPNTAPTLSAPTTSSMKIFLADTANPAGTLYEIYNVTTGSYLTAAGALGTAAWQTIATWNANNGGTGIINTGLSTNVSYTYQIIAKNSAGTLTSASSASTAKYTLAATPSAAPTFSAPTVNSIKVFLTDASNPAGTVYKIYNVTADKYIQADGSTDTTAIWQTLATWNANNSGTGIINTGLSVNTSYTYKVMARNGDGTPVETAYSSESSATYTLANTPSAPTVDTATINSLKVTINQNSNPSNTTYAIKVVYGATTKYLATNGTLGDSAAWDTYANFGGSSGKVATSLSSNTAYTTSVAAKNGGTTPTDYSPTTQVSTLANPPAAASDVSIGTLGTTTFTVGWTDNSSNETGFKVYVAASSDCSGVSFGSPDYTTSAGATSQAYTGKTANTQYCAKIVATNAEGDASAAYSPPIYTLASPPAITLPSSATTTIKVKITSDNSTTYAIQRSTDQLDWKYIHEADGALTSPDAADWQDLAAWNNLDDNGTDVTGLTSGVTYYFRAIARNAASTPTDFSTIQHLATASSISISGHVYTNDAKTTNIGANKTVAVSVNGAAIGGSAETDSNGAFTISNVVVGTNEPLALFVNESGVEANLFTLAVDGSTNISNLELYTNKIVVRNESATAITNANIKTALSCSDCGNHLHLSNPSGSKLNFDEGYNFVVDTGKTYTPGAEIGTIGDLTVHGTLALGGNTLTVTGNLDATGGTITQSGSTIDFTNTSGTQTITPGGQEFGNVTFINAGTRVINGPMVVNGTFNQSGGTLDLTANPNIVIKSDIALVSGTIEKGTGILTMAGNLNYMAAPSMNPGKVAIGASPDTVTLTTDASYDSLTINLGDTLVTAGYNVTVAGDLVISGTLNATSGSGGDSTIHVAGNWTNAGTFTKGGSTVDLNGADSATQIVTGDTTFNNLSASTASNGAGRTIEFASGSTTTVTGTLTATGYSGKILTLARSGVSGTWTIVPTAATVDYASVTNSINTGTAFCTTHSSGTNDTDWYFSDGVECTNTIQFSSASSSGLESVTSVNIPVSLLSAQPSDASVDYTVTSGTATGGGVDFTLASGTATISSGDTSANIALSIVNDTLDEPDETVVVTISNPVNSSLGATTVFTYTILDNDPLPTVSFSSINSSNGYESVTPVNLPVYLSTASGKTVTVPYTVSGTAAGGGVDYTLANGTLTFNPGDTSKNISPVIIDDTKYENSETIVLTLGTPTNATTGSYPTYTYTINDNDNPPMVSLELSNSSDPTIPENAGSATLTARIDAVSGLDTIAHLSFSGTAVNTTDYSYTGDGTITVPAASTSASITLSSIDNVAQNANKTIIVDISSVDNGTETGTQQVTETIINDDVAPTIGSSTIDGITSTTATIHSNISSVGSANVTTRGFKYSSTGQSDDFDAHETSSYSSGTYSLGLSSLSANTLYNVRAYATNPAGTSNGAWTTFRTHASTPATPTVTAVSVSAINVKVNENGSDSDKGDETYAVAIYQGDTQLGWLDQSIGAVRNDADWKSFSAWNNGGSGINTTGFTAGTEYKFKVAAQGSDQIQTAFSSLTSVATVTNPVTLTSSTESIAETDTTSTTITATIAYSVASPTTVTLGFSGTAVENGNYSASASTITIAANQTTGTATLTAINDTLFDPNKTAIVSILSATNAVVGTPGSASVSVVDNDNPPMVSLELSANSMSEKDGSLSLTARLDAVSGLDTTVHLSFTGTAIRSTDYTVSDTAISIGAGTTSNAISLSSIDNHVFAEDKTITIDIDSVVNGTELNAQQITAKITEDDTPQTAVTTPAGTLLLNNGATKTSSPDIKLTITSSTAKQMKISNLSDLSDASWKTFASTKDWTLANGTVNGQKTVYLKLKDDTGQESAVVSSSITLDLALPVDTTAPAAPTNLMASAGVSMISLSWINPTDSDFAKVMVFRSTDQNFVPNISTDLLGLTSSTSTQSFFDTTFAFNTTYYYKVKAVDISGNMSGSSNQATAIINKVVATATTQESEKKGFAKAVESVKTSVAETNATIGKALHIPEKSVPAAATAAAAGFSVVVAAFLAAPNPGTNGAASLVLTFILTGSIRRRRRDENGQVITNPKIEKTLEVFSTLLILFGTVSIISGLMKNPHSVAYIALALAYPVMWFEDIKAILHTFRARIGVGR